MSTCSRVFDPVRWVRRDPTFGHEIMHPSPTAGHALELRCSECMKTWRVAPTFEPTFIPVRHGFARVLRWRSVA